MLMACAAPAAVHPALQWEACAVLRALCQHRAGELPLRWPDVQALVRAHVERVAEAAPTPPTPGHRASRTTASSASMPEKVANQAVRLAGDFASASCKLVCEAEESKQEHCLVSLAADFTATMAACADCAAAPAVRAAAYAALAATPPELWAALPGEQVEREVAAMRRVVETDGVPAVRAHAVAAAAAAVSHVSSFAKAPGAWAAAAAALLHACRDSGASVRVAAAVALARVCVQLRLLVYPDAGDTAEGELRLGGSSPVQGHTSRPPASSAAEARGDVPVAAVLGPEAWGPLRDAALASAQGGDKTSAHGLRALGCLCALLPMQETMVAQRIVQTARPDLAAAALRAEASGAEHEWSEWLAEALQVMRQGVSSGSAKSAWNACIAAAQVFLRSQRLRGVVELAPLQDLHAAVLAALQHSQNFKVRIHAARALHAADASVCRGGASATLQPVLDGLRAVEAEGAGGGAPGGGARRPDSGRPDPEAHFKYHGELRESLTGVLVELLAACTPAELAAASGDLEWILEFLDGQVAAWSVLTVPDDATDEVPPLPHSMWLHVTRYTCLTGGVR